MVRMFRPQNDDSVILGCTVVDRETRPKGVRNAEVGSSSLLPSTKLLSKKITRTREGAYREQATGSWSPSLDCASGRGYGFMPLAAHGPLRRTSMLPRTRTLIAAAILAAAFYVPVHILADQEEGQGKVAGGNANGNRRTNNLYVVQMAEVPVVSYAGGTNGLPATKPNRGPN